MGRPIGHSSKYYFNEDTYVNMQMLHKYFKFILTSEYKTLRCLIYLQTKMIQQMQQTAMLDIYEF